MLRLAEASLQGQSREDAVYGNGERNEKASSFATGQAAVAVKVSYFSLRVEVAQALQEGAPLALAVMYRDENLSRVCQQPERVVFRSVYSRRPKEPLIMDIDRTFILPFFHIFPSGRPAIDIVIVHESTKKLRKEIAWARLDLGLSYRRLGGLSKTREYPLFARMKSAAPAGIIKLAARLAHFPDGSFSSGFLWDLDALKHKADALVDGVERGHRAADGTRLKSLDAKETMPDQGQLPKARGSLDCLPEPEWTGTWYREDELRVTRARRQRLVHEAQQLQRFEEVELGDCVEPEKLSAQLRAAERRANAGENQETGRSAQATPAWQQDGSEDSTEDEEEKRRLEMELRRVRRRQKEARTVLFGGDREAAQAMRNIRARALELALDKNSTSLRSAPRPLIDVLGEERDDESCPVTVFPQLHVKAADCSIKNFASLFLETSPEEMFALCPVPLFSPDRIFRNINKFLKKGSSASESTSLWLHSPQHVCNKLLDKVVSRDLSSARVTDETDPKKNTLYSHLFASCQCVSASSAFSFVATNVAIEIVERHLFGISENSLFLGSLPFDNPHPSGLLMCTKAQRETEESEKRDTIVESLKHLQQRIVRAQQRAHHAASIAALEAKRRRGEALSKEERKNLAAWKETAVEEKLQLQRKSSRAARWTGRDSRSFAEGERWPEPREDVCAGEGGRNRDGASVRVSDEKGLRQGWKRQLTGPDEGFRRFESSSQEGAVAREDSVAAVHAARKRWANFEKNFVFDGLERQARERRKTLEVLKRQWTGGDLDLRLLPDNHPFSVFRLFKFDKMFMAKPRTEEASSGGQLAILVLGDEEHDIEEASKLYGIEIQAQNLMNDAIVELKRRGGLQTEANGDSARGVSTKRGLGRDSLTALQVHVMAAIDYKGFRVVVFALPATVPRLLNWPQPVASQLSEELAFVEQRLNLASLVKPQTWKGSFKTDEVIMKTVLLSLDPSSDDAVVFYRLCFAFPQMDSFSLEDEQQPRSSAYVSQGKRREKICERIRCNAFVHARDIEMAIRHQPPTQLSAVDRACRQLLHVVKTAKTGNASHLAGLQRLSRGAVTSTYLDPLVHSPIVNMYAPDEILALAELEGMPPCTPSDSISLTHFFHLRGINMRLLGHMIRGTRAAWLQHMLQVEVVARTVKRILKDVLRSLVFSAHGYLQTARARAQGASMRRLLKRPSFDLSAAREMRDFHPGDHTPEESSESDDDDDTSSIFSRTTTDDSVEQQHHAGGKVKLGYPRESLLREAALNVPFGIASQLLDDVPYLRDLMSQTFRHFSWADILLLNLFNLTLGDSSESDEFWASFLTARCSEYFGLEAASIAKSRISRTALYIAMQVWLPGLRRTLELPSRLPLLQLVKNPGMIPLHCQQDSDLVVSPSPSQILLAKFIGHTLVQCAVPLWRVWDVVERGLDSNNLLAAYVSTKAHPLLIRQNSWHLPNAVLDVVGGAIRFGVWKVARYLAERCLNFYPESHAAATQNRLMAFLAELHGSGLPPSNPRLVNLTGACGRAIKDHWEDTHPVRLDLLTYQAWHMHVSGDLSECAWLLHCALTVAATMIGHRSYTDRNEVRKLLMLTSLSLKPFREQLEVTTPRQVTNLRMAGLLRLLARSKLLWLLEGDQKRKCQTFSNPGYRNNLATEACNCLQWALDAYDFHLGTETLLTVGTAYELALAIFLLRKSTRSDEALFLVETAARLAEAALRVRTKLFGRQHVTTLNTALLLGLLLADQGKHRRAMSLIEAVIRNSFIRTLWCLPDAFFYDTFHTHGRVIQPDVLHDALLAHRKRREEAAATEKRDGDGEQEQQEEDRAKNPTQDRLKDISAIESGRVLQFKDGGSAGQKPTFRFARLSRSENEVEKNEPQEADDEDDEPVALVTFAEQSRDSYAFLTHQDEAPSDLLIPAIQDLEDTLIRIYINHGIDSALERRLCSLFLTLDVIERKGYQPMAVMLARYEQTSAGDDDQCCGYLRWLLDSSASSEMQALEYIQHYPNKKSRAEIFNPDGDLSFAICHGPPPTKGSKYSTALDRFVNELVCKAQAAVVDVHRRLLGGEKPKLFARTELPSWKRKLVKAMQKMWCILILLDVYRKRVPPDNDAEMQKPKQSPCRALPDELDPKMVRATVALLGKEKFQELFPNQPVGDATVQKLSEEVSVPQQESASSYSYKR
ncbi:conserved hypothetical protein [Neospora caninum Liverpool]|uniref:CLU central domain-containing protein n=1 Tax=Neospora caninum (strain Liverpool) TaxID=572307 RepID=F0V922_NEOCL|nr:conserved hypothetical protein [Neospora caninum Liverpool]CBZ50213.1 conserved hypothetical protein [Neospora caninum Liverpool]|eukprot:XP_003880248.1 conserved hypothetical protein [Neospora caninum Liverpool]